MRVLLLALLALAACTDRGYSPPVPEAFQIGTIVPVFAVTSRQREDDGSFGFNRSEKLSMLKLDVSIPPTHKPGKLIFGYSDPDPSTQFTIAQETDLAGFDSLKSQLRAKMNKLPRGEREITVFVHGYNSTQTEAAYRAAQVSYDLKVPGAMVVYSWPSRGHPLGYVYDNDSMLFARDGLENMLLGLEGTGVERVIVVAHSMGSALTMETLRQIEIRKPGWASKSLGGVMLLSPDIDVEVFRTQFERLSEPPEAFLVFVSRKDGALNLSRKLRGGKQRLGNIENISAVQDLPIRIVDTTAFSGDAESGHLVLATSPSLIALLNGALDMTRSFDSELISVENILKGNTVIRTGLNEYTLSPVPEIQR